ncbi:ferredoxin [Streptomyces sp. RKND-216]|uniref:ferredoxin n=1 Tax=Streptomyces sp. RKND-216 TaxID=2562581 RepID=UPI00109DB237|nr:ferredoxin [Streptomyces sp. RKND-216]THA24101.1 ferredoxin [Streptomyces sp. RKND-216]
MTTGSRWRVQADHGACMGTGICAGIAPHRFRVIDGRSVPTPEESPPDQEVWDAVESCPMEALRILDAASGEILSPI